MRYACLALLVCLISIPDKLAAQAVMQPQVELFNGKEVVAGEVLVQFKAAVAEQKGTMTASERLASEQISLAEVENLF